MEWNVVLQFYILILILMYAIWPGNGEIASENNKFYFKKEENHFHLIFKERR